MWLKCKMKHAEYLNMKLISNQESLQDSSQVMKKCDVSDALIGEKVLV